MKGLPASAALAIPAPSYASRPQAQVASGYRPPPPGWYIRSEVRGAFPQRVGDDPTMPAAEFPP